MKSKHDIKRGNIYRGFAILIHIAPLVDKSFSISPFKKASSSLWVSRDGLNVGQSPVHLPLHT